MGRRVKVEIFGRGEGEENLKEENGRKGEEAEGGRKIWKRRNREGRKVWKLEARNGGTGVWSKGRKEEMGRKRSDGA